MYNEFRIAIYIVNLFVIILDGILLKFEHIFEKLHFRIFVPIQRRIFLNISVRPASTP